MAYEVRMPVLSQSMIQGTVVEWLIQEGEKVDKGAVLVVVESDKATHELEAPQSGILRKILVQAGKEVDVNAPIAIIASAEEGAPAVAPTVGRAPSTPAAVEPSLSPPTTRRKSISPLAKRLAKELGVDAGLLTGSGLGGMVIQQDVRLFAGQHAAAAPVSSMGAPTITPLPPFKSTPLPLKDDKVIPLIGQRGRIAERMSLSRHTAADVTTVMDVDMGRIVSLHASIGFSYTAYITWAVAQTLREYPALNAWLVEDRIILKKDIHLGVAVATDEALVVPVLRHADTKKVSEIDQEITSLGKTARASQLVPDDMKGSTFTITNSGVFGSLLFTPIINLPEVAILGVGKIADTPIVRHGQVVPGQVMYLCLSYDHRAVDGAMAVKFLASLKQRLENPD